ncbi:dynein axonemal intermediate chain 7-like [Phlebotomus argentipes]|uniref:dynein axonemal intermediate chain 7-like n=1 Tax=Phlebotomus argentipes TaxID=94469 RepID=UPI002893016E|nr:dynein axonemal intermediate chain 7-like [Phlebotomus argentipes]
MGPKKKLSKKEKAKLDAEHAEHVRQEQEKERQKTLQEEQERQKREREEAEDRQQQELVENRIRRVQLKESVEFFLDFRQKISEIYAEQKKQNEWKRYMRCNGLPNAQNPGDLRQYIHMWMEKEDIMEASERNWLLMTNEETLLTQNRDVVDLTRGNVKKLQPNIGDLYASRVQEVLGVSSKHCGVCNDFETGFADHG